MKWPRKTILTLQSDSADDDELLEMTVEGVRYHLVFGLRGSNDNIADVVQWVMGNHARWVSQYGLDISVGLENRSDAALEITSLIVRHRHEMYAWFVDCSSTQQLNMSAPEWQFNPVVSEDEAGDDLG
jgi:hypothetical protein